MPQRLVTRRFWVRHRGVVGYLILMLVVFYLYNAQQDTNADIKHAAVLGVRTHSGVCRLRDDIKRRVAQSEAFIASHPNGIPGISVKQLQIGVAGQRRTIRALRVIGPCPP
jgi:hypothetical protein